MSDLMGNRVKSAILGAGLTQKQIASAIGVSQQSVAKWIKDGKICRENMLLLSKVTGYTFNWLSTGTGMRRRHHANTLYRLLAESGNTHSMVIEKLDIAPKTFLQWTSEIIREETADALAKRIADVVDLDRDTLSRALQQVGMDEYPHMQDDPSDMAGHIPVTGTLNLEASQQWHAINDHNIGYVNLQIDDPNAYAVITKGSAYAPVMRSGWILVIEPYAQAEPGEYTLVRNKLGEYMLCELLYQTRSEVSFCSIMDSGRRATLSLDEIDLIQKIGMILPPSKLHVADYDQTPETLTVAIG